MIVSTGSSFSEMPMLMRPQLVAFHHMGSSAHGGAARGGVATAGSTRGRGALYSSRRGVLPGVPKRAAP